MTEMEDEEEDTVGEPVNVSLAAPPGGPVCHTHCLLWIRQWVCPFIFIFYSHNVLIFTTACRLLLWQTSLVQCQYFVLTKDYAENDIAQLCILIQEHSSINKW